MNLGLGSAGQPLVAFNLETDMKLGRLRDVESSHLHREPIRVVGLVLPEPRVESEAHRWYQHPRSVGLLRERGLSLPRWCPP
jgi:hypothetical protein